ncbi:MAG TPA: DNA polymerase III subunit gamma/tau, partial [Acidimicrobiales bacterium]|nr:DNA polymerase III subunit gamma/tau [Acidimicrobiales bacterium]
MADAPYQSLYRRYRPQRFGEVRGQDHVTTALRNAVRNDRVGHAYLFSGPRGTGKTSVARILAKALNCTNLQDGEPDGVCESCLAVQAGTSLDVVELDAASNNGVDAMRDLVARAALASPGRRKVYIVDEVHMLTAAASNALLKTLEEPPAHVVFVLATTDPQKVLPTIRSRTQAFEFHLLGPEVLSSLLADVNDRAGLELGPETLERVARRGNGSARDALSALDQAVAAGGAEDEADVVPAIVDALAARDASAALVAVAQAVQRGRDPRRVAEEVIEHLRTAFLVVMAPAVSGAPEGARAALAEQATRLGTAALVRAMEVLGDALIDMREALDTRVTLEVALVRLCAAAADTSPAAVLQRIEALERALAAGGPPGGPGGRPPAGPDGGHGATVPAPPAAVAAPRDAASPAPPRTTAAPPR